MQDDKNIFQDGNLNNKLNLESQDDVKADSQEIDEFLQDFDVETSNNINNPVNNTQNGNVFNADEYKAQHIQEQINSNKDVNSTNTNGFTNSSADINNFSQSEHQQNSFNNQQNDMPSYTDQMNTKIPQNQNVQGGNQNLYQAPNTLHDKNEYELDSMENYSTWYSMDGRIGRMRYLSYQFVMPVILSLVLGMVVGIISALILPLLGEPSSGILLTINLLASLPGYYFQLYVIPKRRLHDLNQSAWFLLIMLVPLVNFIFILYLLFAPGTEGENDYGSPNRENEWWHYAIGIMAPLIIIAMIGMLAAIALPAYQDYTDRAREAQEQSIQDYQ